MITPAVWAGLDRCAPEEPEQARIAYAARRTYAYGVGEALALQRTISADAYLFLYKELVRLCKDRTYCWAGVTWLAQRLQTSPGTVKRWLTQLVSAGLIQRTPRPGGDTALTSVPALQAYDQQARANCPPASLPANAPTRESGDTHSASPEAIRPSEPSFFVPDERISRESCAGSASSRHTFKRPDPNPGSVGSGKDIAEHNVQIGEEFPLGERPVVRRLVEAGVADRSVLQELASMPLVEIEAICRYVARQPHTYNPPGLIVALARTGLGPALLRRQEPSAGHQRAARGSGQPRSARAACRGGAEPVAATGEAAPSEWSALWTAARQLLAERMSAAEFAAWLDVTSLVTYHAGQAVIGVPNVFARDMLTSRYQPSIVEVLHTLTGAPVTVEVVIG